MEDITIETLNAVIEILGNANISGDETDSRVSALVKNPMTTRRLVDWPPEAFGLVLISHQWNNINLPTTFSAQNEKGNWLEFDFDCEPIFTASLSLATQMYHNGPREIFKNVSLRSGLLSAIHNARNAGATLNGGTLAGPALNGIPAEIYQSPQKTLWHRIFS